MVLLSLFLSLSLSLSFWVLWAFLFVALNTIQQKGPPIFRLILRRPLPRRQNRFPGLSRGQPRLGSQPGGATGEMWMAAKSLRKHIACVVLHGSRIIPGFLKWCENGLRPSTVWMCVGVSFEGTLCEIDLKGNQLAPPITFCVALLFLTHTIWVCHFKDSLFGWKGIGPPWTESSISRLFGGQHLGSYVRPLVNRCFQP